MTQRKAFFGRRVLAAVFLMSLVRLLLSPFVLFNKSFGTKDRRSCNVGNFSSIQQWKSLFPEGMDGMGLGKEKAMVFIPVGAKSAIIVDTLVRNMGTEYFHFLLVRYEDYDWSTMPWFDRVEWEDQPENSCTNWAMAKLFLDPPKVEPFSHVCIWDEDLSPTVFFDGAVFLQWLQQLNLELAQPMIWRNAHPHYEGTAFGQRPKNTQVHEVETVEIQAPCYSKKIWSSCIWPRIIKEFSTGWGIDIFVHRAKCAPASVYSLSLALDHEDRKTLEQSTAMKELKIYEQLAKERNWGKRTYFGLRKDFHVFVDKQCHITMRSARSVHMDRRSNVPKND